MIIGIGGLIVGFAVGLLVGRKNKALANKTATIATTVEQKAVDLGSQAAKKI